MTIVLDHLSEWKRIRSTLQSACGFVPTMGNLHEGHASLLRRCKHDNPISVLSIFVNPTQFNQQDDFLAYPKTREHDLKWAERCGVDYVLFPTEMEIYPDRYAFQIHETHRSHLLEGEHRAGHFSGVLTVVLKLMHLVQPEKLYLGEKDFQQYQLIRDMAQAFFLDIEVIPCETIRLPSGLPLSSRNNRLNPKQFHRANEFAKIFHQQTCSIVEIESQLKAEAFKVDYIVEQECRRFVAVWIDDVRLIDNYSV